MREIDHIANAIKAAELVGIDALDFLEAALALQTKNARLRPEDAPRIIECAQAIAEYVKGMAKPEETLSDPAVAAVQQYWEAQAENAPVTAPEEGIGVKMFKQVWEKFRGTT